MPVSAAPCAEVRRVQFKRSSSVMRKVPTVMVIAVSAEVDRQLRGAGLPTIREPQRRAVPLLGKDARKWAAGCPGRPPASPVARIIPSAQISGSSLFRVSLGSSGPSAGSRSARWDGTIACGHHDINVTELRSRLAEGHPEGMALTAA